jgi:hypothetical protein
MNKEALSLFVEQVLADAKRVEEEAQVAGSTLGGGDSKSTIMPSEFFRRRYPEYVRTLRRQLDESRPSAVSPR